MQQVIYNERQLNAKSISELKILCIQNQIKIPQKLHKKKLLVERILYYQQIQVPDLKKFSFFHQNIRIILA